MSKCINCGEELLEGAKFCMHCGQRQPEESETLPAEPVAEAAAQEPEMPESSRFFAAATLEETAKDAKVENPTEAAAVSEGEAEPVEPQAVPETPAEPEKPAEPAAPVRLTFDPPAAPSFAPAATAVLEKPVQQEAKPAEFTAPPVPAVDPEKPGNKSKWQVMSTWGYVGAILLMCLPVIGLIFSIVWACGGCRKYAKRNLARAALIFMAIGVILTVAAALVLRFVFPELLVYAFEFFNPGYTIVF